LEQRIFLFRPVAGKWHYVIKPKDKAELDFFLELAKRVGAEVQTYEDIQDEQLLKANKNTPKVDKKEVFETLYNILNDKQVDYKP
jgi:hypothetical protein